jgi:hypothetical protein
VNEYAGVPEETRRKHWNRDQSRVFGEQGQHIGRQRHFGDVKLMMPQHAKEYFFNRQLETSEIDTLDADSAVEQGAGAVVIRTRHRKPQLAHAGSPRPALTLYPTRWR